MPDVIKITDFSAPELDIYARFNENQLLHFFEPKEGIFIAESPKVILRALEARYEPISCLMEEGKVREEEEKVLECCKDIPVYTAKFDVLTRLTGYQLTRGMLCAMHRKKLLDPGNICRQARRIAILEEVVNPTNVGAIFRSAAALGMDGVLLTAGCSNPLYRRAIRVSMGTVFQIPWTFFDTGAWPEKGMEFLRENGFKTVAMALCDNSLDIDDPELAGVKKLAVILGTEGEGLAQKTIAQCDYTVRIPMSHGVDSLNVAAASAVAFWQLGCKNKNRGNERQ